LLENGVQVKYLHSEVETLERLEILKELREWKIDVIVGVNLLREGLDLPEVSKICILDADKMWFLRTETSLIQIIWRASRNVNWKVYMYSEKLKNFSPADFSTSIEANWLYRLDNWKLVNDDGLIISEPMRKAINLTNYRRNLQMKYNKEHGIEPKTILSSIKDIWVKSKNTSKKHLWIEFFLQKWKWKLGKEIKRLELEMDIASSNLDFERAVELRDMILELKVENWG
jgi:excinuclease ABC subunit B